MSEPTTKVKIRVYLKGRGVSVTQEYTRPETEEEADAIVRSLFSGTTVQFGMYGSSLYAFRTEEIGHANVSPLYPDEVMERLRG